MAQVYSVAIYEVHNLNGNGPSLSPGPGLKWVIRGVDAVIGGASLGNVQLIGGAGQVVWTDSSIALAPSYLSYRGRYVVDQGVSFFVATTAAMDVSVWGYALTLP